MCHARQHRRGRCSAYYLDIMVENVRFMRRFMGSPDLAAYGPRELSPGAAVEGEALREWIRQVIIPTNFHPVATAAKMPKEMGGVVDEELFVHGAENLRIVDGSVMPLLPGANTQQTVYMLAEKVSLLSFLLSFLGGILNSILLRSWAYLAGRNVTVADKFLFVTFFFFTLGFRYDQGAGQCRRKREEVSKARGNEVSGVYVNKNNGRRHRYRLWICGYHGIMLLSG